MLRPLALVALATWSALLPSAEGLPSTQAHSITTYAPAVFQTIRAAPFTNSTTQYGRTISYTPYSSYLSSTATNTIGVSHSSNNVSVVYSTSISISIIYSTSIIYTTTTAGCGLTGTTSIYSSSKLSAVSTSPGIPEPTTSSGMLATTSAIYGPSGTNCDGATMGSFKCVRGGIGWAICNWGSWVDMGSVAAGTICEGAAGDAEIVAI